jgi:hypothetical protein
VNALFNDGLVDAETRDMALEETPLVGSVPAAPAATLAWMVIDGPLEKELFEATRAEVAAEPAFAMAADRARIVAEAQTRSRPTKRQSARGGPARKASAAGVPGPPGWSRWRSQADWAGTSSRRQACRPATPRPRARHCRA